MAPPPRPAHMLYDIVRKNARWLAGPGGTCSPAIPGGCRSSAGKYSFRACLPAAGTISRRCPPGDPAPSLSPRGVGPHRSDRADPLCHFPPRKTRFYLKRESICTRPRTAKQERLRAVCDRRGIGWRAYELGPSGRAPRDMPGVIVPRKTVGGVCVRPSRRTPTVPSRSASPTPRLQFHLQRRGADIQADRRLVPRLSTRDPDLETTKFLTLDAKDFSQAVDRVPRPFPQTRRARSNSTSMANKVTPFGGSIPNREPPPRNSVQITAPMPLRLASNASLSA